MTRLVTLAALMLLAPAFAQAQMEDDLTPVDRTFESPERYAFEFRIGPYEPDPDGNGTFELLYDDLGPLVIAELDVIALRLDEVLYLALGGWIGTGGFDGKALDCGDLDAEACGAAADFDNRASEETSFQIIPLALMGVVRLDVLTKKVGIPFIFAGKLGYQWMHWDSETGANNDGSGWSLGLIWGAQVALDLNFFEPSAARSMDEEWGINQSTIFFELYGFDTTSDSLDLGGLNWAAGLGFIF